MLGLMEQDVPRQWRWRSLGIPLAHAAALLLIGGGLAAWSVVVSRALTPASAAFFVLYPLCAYYLGRLLLGSIVLEPILKQSFALTFQAGYLALHLLQFAVHSLLPGPLVVQFGAIFGVAALGQFVRPSTEQDGPEPLGDALMGLFLTAFCLAAATCWTRGLLHSVEVQGDQVVFHNWHDFFVHALIVSRFTAGQSLWALGHAELSGQGAIFYHYASYLGPATGTLFTGQSAYDAALSIWVPMGTFLTGLAAFTLVRPWAGRLGGLCATAALLTLPDVSHYWPANGFLGYHWLQQVGPAGQYGVVCGALVLTLLLQWHRRGSTSALLAGLAFTAAGLFFKAQVFAVLVPLVGACLVLWLPGVSAMRRGLLFAALAVLGIGVMVLLVRQQPERFPFLFDRAYFENYNRYCLAPNFRSSFCRDVLLSGFAGLGRTRYYAAALSVCAVASFGVWLILGGVLLLVVLYRREGGAADVAPWIALAIYLALYAGLNDWLLVGHNQWELIHRPVVWAYFLLCTWCAARAGLLLSAAARGRRAVPAVVGAASVLLLALPYHMGLRVQQGKSVWASSCHDVRQPLGLLDCARFLAHHCSPAAVVQDSACDDRLVVGAFAERSSFLARPEIWLRDKSPVVRAEVPRRSACLTTLMQATEVGELRRLADATGVRWFLLEPDQHVRWPSPVVNQPVFVSHGYRVYDLKNLGG